MVNRYWDQASALVQVSLHVQLVFFSSYSIKLGLLDASKYPVAGREVAQKVLDPFGLPSNTLLTRWKESEGKVVD